MVINNRYASSRDPSDLGSLIEKSPISDLHYSSFNRLGCFSAVVMD